MSVIVFSSNFFSFCIPPEGDGPKNILCINKSNVDLTITGFERRKMSKSFTCITGGNTNFIVGSNHNIKAVSNVNIHTESMLNMDSNFDTTIDTPTNFLVGTNIKPGQATVEAGRIDLNP